MCGDRHLTSKVGGRGRQRIGQLDGGDYPPSHSSRPNLSFKPLNDRNEEALPPVAKDGVLDPIHIKSKCMDRTQGSDWEGTSDRPGQGGDLDRVARGVSHLGLHQKFWDKSSL
jgi:hypothetical protein